MRLWISPDHERIDLDDLDDGISHSIMVVDNPALYGIDPVSMQDYMRSINNEETDEIFDYDAVITLAEMDGWVRVSRDAANGRLAISASKALTARRAVRKLEEDGFYIGSVDLHFEWIVGGVIRSEFRILDEDDLALFVRHGRLPRADQTDMPFEAISLATSVLEARVQNTRSFTTI